MALPVENRFAGGDVCRIGLISATSYSAEN